MKRKIKTLALAALIAALSGGAWYLCNRGVTNEDLREDIHGAENRLELRFDYSDAKMEGVEARLSEMDGKLDRIEAKLDRILDIATRPMPDDMTLK